MVESVGLPGALDEGLDAVYVDVVRVSLYLQRPQVRLDPTPQQSRQLLTLHDYPEGTRNEDKRDVGK